MEKAVHDFEAGMRKKLKKMITASTTTEEKLQQEKEKGDFNEKILPMPLHKFCDDLDEIRDSELKNTQLKTAEVAREFYNQYFRKYQKHASTQSKSIDEIFMGIASDL